MGKFLTIVSLTVDTSSSGGSANSILFHTINPKKTIITIEYNIKFKKLTFVNFLFFCL